MLSYEIGIQYLLLDLKALDLEALNLEALEAQALESKALKPQQRRQEVYWIFNAKDNILTHNTMHSREEWHVSHQQYQV